jgi:hypothetical protein
VRPGVSQTLTIDHDAGLLRLRMIDSRLGEAPVGEVFWEVLDGSGRSLWTTGEASPALPLASGRYLIRGEHRDKRVEQNVQLTAGEDKTVEVALK